MGLVGRRSRRRNHWSDYRIRSPAAGSLPSVWSVVGPQVATAAVTEVGVSVAVQVAVPAAGSRDVDGLLAFLLDGQGDVEHSVVIRKL